MSAPLAMHDPRYGTLHDTVSAGYFGLGEAACPKRFDGGDIVAAQLALHDRCPRCSGVQKIAESRCSFEVVDRIVDVVEIAVIDLGKTIRVGDESQCHQAVDLSISDQFSDLKPDEDVSPFVDGITFLDMGTQDASFAGILIFGCGSRFSEAPDPAEIADFVEVAEPIDRDGSPFLECRDRHAAGFPSVYSRSEIKSPSHASTFGGLALDSTDASRIQEIGG